MVSRVKRYFLEIKDFSKTVDLNLPENFQIILDDKDNFHLNRFFYKQIGVDHYWRDRLLWSDSEWVKYVTNKNLETHVIKKGEDLVIVATGETLQRAYLASEILKESNIHCSIISMHTIKPFDKKTFIEFSKNSKAILTVEEHSIFGGLGECCASLIAQNNINVKLKILGIPDEYMINGSQADVLDHYDMSPEKIAEISKDLLNK